jgi:hypothetical protein
VRVPILFGIAAVSKPLPIPRPRHAASEGDERRSSDKNINALKSPQAMFKKTTSAKKQTESVSRKPKYERPKILAIDLGREVLETLGKEGFNVVGGTFGTPYRVLKGSNYEPVIVKASLPNYTEQEIIIADLVPDEPTERAQGEKSTPDDELDWWAKCYVFRESSFSQGAMQRTSHISRIRSTSTGPSLRSSRLRIFVFEKSPSSSTTRLVMKMWPWALR